MTNGQGVNLIVDFIGAGYFQNNVNSAARDGRIVLLGLMGGGKISGEIDISALLYKRVRVEGSTLRSREVEYQRRLRDTLVEHAMPRFRDGSFKVFIEKVFPMQQIADAHRLLESNATKGKLICVID